MPSNEQRKFGVTVPEGMVWTYRITVRGDGRPEHMWTLKSQLGGIHVSAWISPCLENYPAEWMGGIECHLPPQQGQKPDHEHCWLLGGPCCHDGSSLQFSEQIAPWLPYPEDANPHLMRDSHHELVLSIMLNRHRIWIEEADHAAQ